MFDCDHAGSGGKADRGPLVVEQSYNPSEQAAVHAAKFLRTALGEEIETLRSFIASADLELFRRALCGPAMQEA